MGYALPLLTYWLSPLQLYLLKYEKSPRIKFAKTKTDITRPWAENLSINIVAESHMFATPLCRGQVLLNPQDAGM